MTSDFTCPPGGSTRRTSAAGEATSLLPSGASARDIIDVVVTILITGDPQSMRYILTDDTGVKYYSDWKTTVPSSDGASTDWFALSFGFPLFIIAPPPIFTPNVIATKTIDMPLLAGVLDKNQFAIAASLTGISRLTYVQEFLGAPIAKFPNADKIIDIEFETRNTAVGAPVYEMGQIYAKVAFDSSDGSSGVGSVILDDFERSGTTSQSNSTGTGVGSIKKTVAIQTGTSSKLDGLLYVSLEYNPINNEFLTINTAGSGHLTRIDEQHGFRDAAIGFISGTPDDIASRDAFNQGLGRDCLAMSPIANEVYVVEAHKGTLYKIPLTSDTPIKQIIADNLNLATPSVPVPGPIMECDADGSIILEIDTQFYRITPSGSITNIGQSDTGVSNTLFRSGSDFYIVRGAQIIKANLSSINGSFLTDGFQLDTNLFGVIVSPDGSAFYAIGFDIPTIPNPAGTRIIRIDRANRTQTTVFTAPSGKYICGIAFGQGSGLILHALLSTIAFADVDIPARVELVEIAESSIVTSDVSGDPGSAPDGWTASGTGGALLGTLGDNTDISTAQRIILSKIPPGGGCQMYYKQVQWYERGWRIDACCGAWIEYNGIQWLIVKRSIGIDTTCGGGESESTICIEQYVQSGQGHPAIAWPTIDGQEFLGIPTSGFVNFIRDPALSSAILDKLELGGSIETKGDPISQIPFILFPAP